MPEADDSAPQPPSTPELTGAQDAWAAYRLRWKRRRLLARAVRQRRQLTEVSLKNDGVQPSDILLFATLRNELLRLPHFLDHYRALGVAHFFVVDNGSDDGSVEYLRQQDDVSLWSTQGSYRRSRFGLDWLTWLQIKFGHGHWCLTVDADEILVYPYWETRPLPALTDWLDASGRRAFPAMMLDMYPEGPLGSQAYEPGEDPMKVLPWFDCGNYGIRRQLPMENLWIQGGARARLFFAKEPRRAPTLNKIPLVKWNRRFVYVNSTHAALPRKLNRVYAREGGEWPSGVLLHTKFLPSVVQKSEEEIDRREHFANSDLYDDYYRRLMANPVLWSAASRRYTGWRQLEAVGLMSRGGWI